MPIALIACGVSPMWPITGMPGLHDRVDDARAADAALDLDRLRAALAEEAAGVEHGVVGRRVGQERHVADDQRALRAPDHRLGVVEHLVHRHAHGGVVAEHHLGQRVADEDQRDAGLVDQRRGGEVVRGDRRDPDAVGVELGDVDDGEATDGLGLGAHRLGLRAHRSSLRRGPPFVQRGSAFVRRRPRSSSRLATRSSSRSATSRLDSSGRSSRDPSAPRIETRLVSVPNPEPASATSLATRRSAPFRRSFSGARSRLPVSAANPTMTGRGSSEPALAPTSARMSSVGSSSMRQAGVAGELGRWPRGPGGSRRRRRP